MPGGLFMERDYANIPDIVIGRLPLYLREVQRMHLENRLVTSSQEMAERLGLSAAQIRKDLSMFGEFGKQGTGYKIAYLIEQLSSILKTDHVWELVVVGAGDVGHALARYQGFKDRGFRVVMVFDNNPEKIGGMVGDFTIMDTANLVEIVQQAGIKVAMLAVPADQAQAVANMLVEAGIKAILNYAPIHLNVPPEVHVQHTDPATHLQRMTYYLDLD
jgi:redox-sensing transcriptional repressor